ncbi:peptidoglycan bridge formation glycyltransferase FemA/FemB family protein [Peribacillus sp. AS_2]|uniref:peptidoglycan bridge formation glycyltransferase FemA/FemB family protein n=1 Tax=Peribacillus sp. AS_2 TaxID=2996755 RepID=UPI0022A7F7F1|nr:peptidoglycan bridge formation glycyltransferase FemA/FemB family protein [Peribacillus sp. AS_2]MCZ0873509.1 peptidoglycan bridge formation glycyltransferase FemA/FemB family protein [Peribacillus sp. AS_2]
MQDIYFESNYGKLYERIENGTCEIFKYSSFLGNVYHMFLKRKIPLCVNDGKSYFDIVTPYGYGGPLITDFKEGYKNELLNGFKQEFQKYCNENNIVSEFVRFHPLADNAQDFKEIYKIENIRTTVGTNISDYTDPVLSEFSKSARKSIRKALNSGVTYKITEKPNSINNFKQIYYSTMDRNGASNYYYFDDIYFNSCLELFKDNIILVEVNYEDKTIASGFYFVYGKIIHAHLSGTLQDYLHLSPAYIIKYATVKWAKENGKDIVHYGGGTSNSKEDPLYQFKRKFGRNSEFEFYIGKKVWNREIYNELCEKKEIGEELDFFPAYRKNSV